MDRSAAGASCPCVLPRRVHPAGAHQRLAYSNTEIMYGCCSTSPPTPCSRSADPKHSGARIGATLVLHTWARRCSSSARARDRHRRRPRTRCRAVGCRASQASSSRCGCSRGCSGAASSKSCRTLHRDGQLKFFGEHLDLADAEAFADWLMPLRQCEWVVYAKRPFAGPEQVLAYLSRYTHRVAISNSRLLALDDRGVTFRWKDYREHGRTRYKTMTLATEEFMRRFLLHVLPSRLSSHPPLRLARQRQPPARHRHRSRSAASAGANASR